MVVRPLVVMESAVMEWLSQDVVAGSLAAMKLLVASSQVVVSRIAVDAHRAVEVIAVLLVGNRCMANPS